MSETGTAKRGRRCEGEEAKRAHINFRVAPTLKQRLESAANDAGVPLSHEVERRLQRSFEADDLRTIVREEVRAAVQPS